MSLLTDDQRMYAMYVIGKVESGHNWASVNYNDPITIGMMQNYGTRAAALLVRLSEEAPESYAKIAQSLRNDVSSHDKTSNWWTTRYLTRAEGESWGASSEDDENRKIQQDQFLTDMKAYEEVFEGWGAKSNNAKTVIYIASMYHQGPRYCGQVVQTVGANADLGTIHAACLNNRVLGVYKNRYNTVYTTLANWDGVSAPPDFGQVDIDSGSDPETSTGNTSTSQANGVQILRKMGDGSINCQMTDGSSVLCYPSNDVLWYPRTRSTAPANPGAGESGTTAGGSSDFDKMFQVWKDYEEAFVYGQGTGRLDPVASGHTDCSGCIWWAINKVRPDVAAKIGTWTGAMAQNGIEIARGVADTPLDVSKLVPGDILLVQWKSADYTFSNGKSHVEWYVGDGQIWGAPYTPVPHRSGSITDYIKTTRIWMIRRIL